MKNAIARLLQRFGLGADSGPVWDGGPGACVLLVNRWGFILSASDGAASLTGRPRRALIGAKLADLFHAEDRAGIDRAFALGGSAGRSSGRLRSFSGGARAIELNMRELLNGKRAVLLAERSGAAAAEEDLAALRAEAAAARAEAEAARRDARATADLLADLSHEMRTPLNAVIGFADAMQEETFGPLGHEKYDEYAEHIRASGGHLLDLVSSILDLAKIEADRFALKRELANPAALAAECAGIVRLSAEAAGLTLKIDIAKNLPECALDKRAVRQILINLLSNAVKFTSDGEVRLAAKKSGGDIVFTVSDTGVGMNEEELSKLGARFTAAQGSGVRGSKGNGLGLALAFALAELHGGSMTLDSAPGEGLTAEVRLPVKAPAKPQRRLKALAGGAADEKADSGRDAPAILTQLERIEAYRRERAANAA